MLKKAIFLDRDGTLNVDPGYLRHPDQMTLLPNVGQALRLLKNEGYFLIVVSNQSGVGRGLIQLEAMPKILARLQELLVPFGAQIDEFALCFHRPDENCECRKPKPKLILDAAATHGISVPDSYMVGDRFSDLEAGWTAGCKGSLLVRTGVGLICEQSGELARTPDFTGDTLLEIANWVLSRG